MTVLILGELQDPLPPRSQTERSFRDAAAAVSACVRTFLRTAAFWWRPGEYEHGPQSPPAAFDV